MQTLVPGKGSPWLPQGHRRFSAIRPTFSLLWGTEKSSAPLKAEIVTLGSGGYHKETNVISAHSIDCSINIFIKYIFLWNSQFSVRTLRLFLCYNLIFFLSCTWALFGFVGCVQLSYILASGGYKSSGCPLPSGVRCHSTRNISMSWAALKGVPLSDISAAATWSSTNTFSRYYRINVTSSDTFETAVLLGPSTS